MLRMAIRLALLIELICLLAVQPFCFLQPRHCLTLLPTPTAHSITCKGLSASGSDEQNVKPFVNENSFDLIKGNQVIRASDGERLDITYLWTGRTNEKIILVFLRHFGCPFSWEFAGELARDWLPKLQGTGVQLYMVGVGSAAAAAAAAEALGLPKRRVLAAPDAGPHRALGLRRAAAAADSADSAAAAAGRRTGKTPNDQTTKELTKALKDQKNILVPKDSSLRAQQGGVLAFKGRRLVTEHRDVAAGAYADYWDILPPMLT